jgi:hypothetical protein
MNYLVKNIDQYVDDQRRWSEARSENKFVKFLETCFPCFGRFLGNYIVILYLIVKFIYVANTVFQVYLISGLLGKDFWLYGFHFLYNLFQGHGWTISSSKYFPSKNYFYI